MIRKLSSSLSDIEGLGSEEEEDGEDDVDSSGDEEEADIIGEESHPGSSEDIKAPQMEEEDEEILLSEESDDQEHISNKLNEAQKLPPMQKIVSLGTNAGIAAALKLDDYANYSSEDMNDNNKSVTGGLDTAGLQQNG